MPSGAQALVALLPVLLAQRVGIEIEVGGVEGHGRSRFGVSSHTTRAGTQGNKHWTSSGLAGGGSRLEGADDREHRGACPDEAERDHPKGRERLSEERPKRKSHRRRDELDEADRRQRQAPRAPGEKSQRRHRCGAGGQQQQGNSRRVAEQRPPLLGQHQREDHPRNRHQQALDRQPRERVGGDLLADQAVDPEGAGADQGNPRQAAERDGLQRHPDRRQPDGYPSRAAHPFPEEDGARPIRRSFWFGRLGDR